MKSPTTIEAIDQLSIDDLWDASMQLQVLADYAAKRAETLGMEQMMAEGDGEAEAIND